MADSKKYDGSTWEHSLRKLTTATDTFTTLPADIYADGNNATVGISGNTVQSGTPTPSNPVEVQGVGVRTENLWNNASTISKEQTPLYYIANFGTPLPAGTYTFSAKVIGEEGITACRVSFINSNMIQITAGSIGVSSERTSITVILNEPCYAVYMYGGKEPSTFAAVTYQDIMLNTGSTAIPYEPYGYKIPISSANTTTPIYLGEVETTRKIKKIVASELTWTDGTVEGVNFYRASLPVSKKAGGGIATLLSNKYRSVSIRNNLVDGSIAAYNTTTTEVITIRDDRYSSASEWIAANGNTDIWYVLETEETAVVNEPLMKIGDYADTVSGITIPTITGKDTFDVDTTLKPLEVSLSYTGWHDATVKEWDGSQWQ